MYAYIYIYIYILYIIALYVFFIIWKCHKISTQLRVILDIGYWLLLVIFRFLQIFYKQLYIYTAKWIYIYIYLYIYIYIYMNVYKANTSDTTCS